MQAIDLIRELQQEFLYEASSAPKLFRDLGKVEQYIAESYKTRSFIELIQNADDARSTEFGIFQSEDVLIVANDGRPFDESDVEALCRSGSSNKARGGNTIGYRGIGFKSVVNLAQKIHVLSGDFRFCFDREKTLRLLTGVQGVPLIRIPHSFEVHEFSPAVARAVQQVRQGGRFSTLFVFSNIDRRLVRQELQDFDSSSLLFLNNIRRVTCRSETVARDISLGERRESGRLLIDIEEGGDRQSWEVLVSPTSLKDMVALKVRDDTIVPATRAESVVHSFTPTVEFSGAFLKVNGDFSTDPSRKNIDFDEISSVSLRNIQELLAQSVIDIVAGRCNRPGFFSAFIGVPSTDGGPFKVRLFKGLSERLMAKGVEIAGRRVPLSDIRLRPDWLNYEDYERLCSVNFCPVSSHQISVYPELPSFLELTGVRHLYLQEALDSVNGSHMSATGLAEVAAKVIGQYRYDMTRDRLDQIGRLKLFPNSGQHLTAREVVSADDIDGDYWAYLANNVDVLDLKQFILKVGIQPGDCLQKMWAPKSDIAGRTELGSVEVGIDRAADDIHGFTAPAIKNWRSAERNALEFLKSCGSVVAVTDVSAANMGYDLEVMLLSNERLYVEVKSVKSFQESFKMTNNEYASAHSLGQRYCLALVINGEPFRMKLVRDPINSLAFQKQVEQWSWVCDDYGRHLKDVTSVLTKGR